MNKILYGLVAVTASVTMASSAFAETVQLATATPLCNGGSSSGEMYPQCQVIGNGTANVVIQYDQLSLKYINVDGTDTNGAKDENAAYLETVVTPAVGIPTSQAASNTGFKYKVNGIEATKPLSSIAGEIEGDNVTKIDLEAKVTKEKLVGAVTNGITDLDVDIWEFDWNQDGTTDQTFTVRINAMNTTLRDPYAENLADRNLFNPTMAQEMYAAWQASQGQQPGGETTTPGGEANTPADENQASSENPENPNTADPIMLYSAVAVIALLGLGATAFFAKKAIARR